MSDREGAPICDGDRNETDRAAFSHVTPRAAAAAAPGLRPIQGEVHDNKQW